MNNSIYKAGVAALLAGSCAMAGPSPNILVVLVDDMGYSDLGCFGSCIETPTIDRLASEGLTLTQFYNTGRCMPSRTSLLTGLYPQNAGMGYMAEPLDELSYQGHMSHNNVTIAEAMKSAGYWTMHSGKWHVAHTLRDKDQAPCRRGFDRSFLRSFQVNYFNPPWLAMNFRGEKSQCKSKEELGFDDSFYLTDAEADVAIDFLEEWKSEQAAKPFFMYLAFDAPHWPMHARPEDIAKYRWKKDKFRNGWDEVRERRFKAMQKLKIIDSSWTLPPRDPALPAWDDIPGDSDDGWDGVPMSQYDKDDWDMKMAVYAAMVDRMDQKLGDVIDWLEKAGVRDDTLILFMADNGGCPEDIGRNDRREVGTPESYQGCFMPWAQVQNTPFRMYKHWVHEGGIATPCIINWPGGMDARVKGTLNRTPGHLVDVMATCLDVVGVRVPDVFEREGRTYRVQPPDGESLLPLLNGEALSQRSLFFEHEGNRAVRNGDWKLVSRYERDGQLYDHYGFPTEPRAVEWELYNLKEDRTETEDLSSACPEIAARLEKEYQAWAAQSGARPWSELEPVFDLQVAERRDILKYEQAFERDMEPGAVGRGARRFDKNGLGALEADPVDCRNALTLSMWVRFEELPAPGWDCYLLGQMEWPLAGFHLHYRDGQWIFNLLSSDAIRAVKYVRSAVQGEWVHLGATWDGQVARLYLDGEEVQSAVVPYMAPSSAQLRIGGNGRDKGVGGLVDEVRIYNVALSPEIVRGLYRQGNGPRFKTDFERVTPRFAPGDSAGSVCSSVFLPPKLADGSEVVWRTSCPEILGGDGRLVGRPAEDRQVELTATVRLHDMEKSKKFTVTVCGQTH